MKSHFGKVFENRHKESERYWQLLPDTDDLTLMTLKGHLVLEELLFSLAQQHCTTPQHLEKARLSFAQVLHLVRALVAVPIPAEAWQAIGALNTLRNALAHNLEPKDISEKVNDVYRLCLVGMEPLPRDYKKPEEPARVIELCIYSLMGALATTGGMAEILEGLQSQSPNEPGA